MSQRAWPVAFSGGPFCLSDVGHDLIVIRSLRVGSKRGTQPSEFVRERWQVDMFAGVLPYLIEGRVVDVSVRPDGSRLPSNLVSVSHYYLHALMPGSRTIQTPTTQIEQKLNVTIRTSRIFKIQEILFVEIYFLS